MLIVAATAAALGPHTKTAPAEQFVKRLIESPDAMKPGHFADPTRGCLVMR